MTPSRQDLQSAQLFEAIVNLASNLMPLSQGVECQCQDGIDWNPMFATITQVLITIISKCRLLEKFNLSKFFI